MRDKRVVYLSPDGGRSIRLYLRQSFRGKISPAAERHIPGIHERKDFRERFGNQTVFCGNSLSLRTGRNRPDGIRYELSNKICFVRFINYGFAQKNRRTENRRFLTFSGPFSPFLDKTFRKSCILRIVFTLPYREFLRRKR